MLRKLLKRCLNGGLYGAFYTIKVVRMTGWKGTVSERWLSFSVWVDHTITMPGWSAKSKEACSVEETKLGGVWKWGLLYSLDTEKVLHQLRNILICYQKLIDYFKGGDGCISKVIVNGSSLRDYVKDDFIIYDLSGTDYCVNSKLNIKIVMTIANL